MGRHLWTALGLALVAGALFALLSPTQDVHIETIATQSADNQSQADKGRLARGSKEPELNPGTSPRPVAEPPQIVGTVIDAETEAAVQGARVMVLRTNTHDSAFASSNKHGAFSIHGVEPGSWLLIVWHPDYLPAGMQDWKLAITSGRMPEQLRIVVPEDGAEPMQRTVRLSRGRTLHGRVFDAKGLPVGGARIHIQLPETVLGVKLGTTSLARLISQHSPVVTAADGRFTCTCSPSPLFKLQYAAVKGDSICRFIEASLNGDHDTVELRLLEPAAVSGTVRRMNESPAHGVRVLPLQVDTWRREYAMPPVEQAVTAPNGTYSLPTLPPGPTELAAAWGQKGECFRSVAPRAGSHMSDVDFVVSDKYKLQGRLVTKDGAPLAGELIHVREHPSGLLGNYFAAFTDAKGTFKVEALHGPLTVTQHLPGRALELARDFVPKEPVSTFVGERSTITRIDVRVIDDKGNSATEYSANAWSLKDSPVGNEQGLNVEIEGRRGTSTLEVPGELPIVIHVYDVSFDADEQSEEGLTKAIELSEIPASGTVDIVVNSTSAIRGRITDLQRKPIPNLTVSLLKKEMIYDGEGEILKERVPVDADGWYSFPSLPHTTFVRVNSPAGFARVDDIEHLEGGPERFISLARAGTIAGRVHAPNIQSIAKKIILRVTWEQPFGEHIQDNNRFAIPIRPDGTFSFPHAPTDRAMRLAFDSDSTAALGFQVPKAVDGVRAGDQDVALRLVRGLHIQGLVAISGGEKPKLLRIMARSCEEPLSWGQVMRHLRIVDVDSTNTFRIGGLTSGRYALELIGYFERGHAVLARTVVPPMDGVTISVHAPGQIDVELGRTREAMAFVYRRGSALLVTSARERSDRMAIRNLPSDQRYDIRIESEDQVSIHSNVSVGDTIRPKFRKPLLLSGVVRMDSLSVEIEFVPAGEGAPARFSASGSGPFTVGVLEGSYRAVVLKPDFTPIVLAEDLRPGQTDITLTIPPGIGIQR